MNLLLRQKNYWSSATEPGAGEYFNAKLQLAGDFMVRQCTRRGVVEISVIIGEGEG